MKRRQSPKANSHNCTLPKSKKRNVGSGIVSTMQLRLSDSWQKVAPYTSPSNDTNRTIQKRSSFAKCPICQRNISAFLMNSHIDKCIIQSQNVVSVNNDLVPPASQMEHDVKAHQNQNRDTKKPHLRPLQRDSKSCITNPNLSNIRSNGPKCGNVSSSRNSFQLMMSNSKALSRNLKHYLILNHQTQKCTWSSLIPSSDEIKWSSSVKLQIPNEGKKTTNSKLPRMELGIQILSTKYPSITSTQMQLEWSKRCANLQSSHNFSPSVLKSALQKNIRRCRAEPAVKCALALLSKSQPKKETSYLKENMINLIRRLLIIMLEDACFIADAPWLCWYMMALTKEFPVDFPMIQHVLCVVHHLAAMKHRDPLPDKYSSSDMNIEDIFDSEKMNLHAIPVQKATLIFSLLIRITYGGMTGDIQMIKKYAHMWYDRFFTHSALAEFSFEGSEILMPCIENGVYSSIYQVDDSTLLHPSLQHVQKMINNMNCLVLHPQDIPWGAIDFHCSNQLEIIMQNQVLIEKLQRSFESLLNGRTLSYNEKEISDLIKKVIWIFSSGKSLKITIAKNDKANEANEANEQNKRKVLETIWSIIEPKCNQYGMKYIQDRCGFQRLN